MGRERLATDKWQGAYTVVKSWPPNASLSASRGGEDRGRRTMSTLNPRHGCSLNRATAHHFTAKLIIFSTGSAADFAYIE